MGAGFGCQREAAFGLLDKQQFIGAGACAVGGGHAAGDHQRAVFPTGFGFNGEGLGFAHLNIHAHQRAVLGGGGAAAAESAGGEHIICAVFLPGGQIGIMLEVGRDFLVHRQGNPQLHGVQRVYIFRGLLGVGDAVCAAGAGGHQVDLAGAHKLAEA